MAAPIGNRNAAGAHDTERPFREALMRAIKQDDGKRIRMAAEKLLDSAAAGEPWAIAMLADRVDGKPLQQVTGEGSALNLYLVMQEANLREARLRVASIDAPARHFINNKEELENESS